MFVVASARDDFDPASVLFEFDGLRRDSAPSREAGQSIAPAVTSGAPNGGPAYGARSGSAKEGLIVPVCPTLRAGGNKTGGDRPPGTDVDTADSLIPVGVTIHGTDGTATVASYSDLAQCLRARTPGNIDNSSTTVVAQPVVAQPVVLMDQGGSVMNVEHDMVGTLRRETHGHEPAVLTNMAVRRLTPVECERLQGFPDGYTQIPWRKKLAGDCPDGPRYKALGNSWAVPVVAWIGHRIHAAVERGM